MNPTVNDLWEKKAFAKDEREVWHALKSSPVTREGHVLNRSLRDSRDSELLSSTSESAVELKHVKPVRVVPPRPLRRRSFVATSRWEGSVVERFGSYFEAEVINLDDEERASVEFALDEVAPADRVLCEAGALFYWSTGYETKDSGQRSRVSVISFRRTGVTSF